MSDKKQLGKPAPQASGRTWVQTDRKAHQQWAALIAEKPRAAALLHHLVANMGQQNAVVCNQRVLAKMLGCSERTIRTALKDLRERFWIEIVKLNGPGTVNAYVVNDRVAWGERRENMGRFSVFTARIIADEEDQDATLLPGGELRQIPTLHMGDVQLPVGEEEPPAQTVLDGLEHPLPVRSDEN